MGKSPREHASPARPQGMSLGVCLALVGGLCVGVGVEARAKNNTGADHTHPATPPTLSSSPPSPPPSPPHAPDNGSMPTAQPQLAAANSSNLTSPSVSHEDEETYVHGNRTNSLFEDHKNFDIISLIVELFRIFIELASRESPVFALIVQLVQHIFSSLPSIEEISESIDTSGFLVGLGCSIFRDSLPLCASGITAQP